MNQSLKIIIKKHLEVNTVHSDEGGISITRKYCHSDEGGISLILRGYPEICIADKSQMINKSKKARLLSLSLHA